MAEKPDPRKDYGYEDETSKEGDKDKSWFELLLQFMREKKYGDKQKVQKEVV